MRGKLLATLIGVSLCVLLTGCFDSKSLGIGRRPYMPYVAGLNFTDAEKEWLGKWAAESPDLFKKLQKHNNLQADLIRKNNEIAIEVNVKQMQALNYDGDEIKATIYAGLRKVGYPADDPLVKPYAPTVEK